MKAVMDMYAPETIFFDDPSMGIMDKAGLAKLITDAYAAGVWRDAKLTPLRVVQQSSTVAHMILSLTTSTPGTVPQAYMRLEYRGTRWIIVEDFAAWGAKSKGFPTRRPAPEWMKEKMATWSSLWGVATPEEYIKAVWFPDAVIYDRYASADFLTPSDIAPAMADYAKQPGQSGPGSATWGALDVVVSSPTVAHVIGTNMQTPDVAPWYARLEKRGGDWRIAAEVVSIGH
eukprot:TRINITY_DN14478_c0_g2_i1.p1 TRINITY_DN14478_c0_g2~~TRINITY_DN14478_c0_g2_i1.p1  ORF type:complete len:230 (+),score=62.97 TRINITY_DN14478_c0_g2_i1:337-1026(+)